MTSTASHAALVSNFVAAHNKLSLVGQNAAELTDCSEIIPVAEETNGGKDFAAEFPAGTSSKNIEQAVSTHYTTLRIGALNLNSRSDSAPKQRFPRRWPLWLVSCPFFFANWDSDDG